jgi:hypothetical protein
MSAHAAVSLAEMDQLGSFVVPFIAPARAGSEIDALPLKDVGPEDAVGEAMIGRSAALRHVVDEVRMVASTDSTVLICGETGTGKELIARAVHNLSARRVHAFVKCNCAAIPTGLLESELFGHEKGAFTSAVGQRIGRFELANRGTIFLDEIGDTPLELQPKLLRVLQEREFERLGNGRRSRRAHPQFPTTASSAGCARGARGAFARGALNRAEQNAGQQYVVSPRTNDTLPWVLRFAISSTSSGSMPPWVRAVCHASPV